MGDSFRAAGPQPRLGDVLQHPAAARRVSPDAFARGASIFWAHLQPKERKAVRATCRNGRQLHDRLITDLRLTLGRTPGMVEEHQQQQQPSPTELQAALRAVVQRGARLQSLTVLFKDQDDDRRQGQLLAALEACSRCPLTQLELEGAVPLSGAVAEAVAACCPQLSSLHLTRVQCRSPPGAPHQPEAAAEYHYGYSQLLTLCGPRLRDLCLTGTGTEHWRALSYMALRRCTALTRLELQAPDWTSCKQKGDPVLHTSVFSTVAQLATLRSLHLSYDSPPASSEAVRPHATCVARLSALTALTHLRLEPSWCYEGDGDDWMASRDMGSSPEEVAQWCRLAEAHRGALLSALRRMPQLQVLESTKLWLRPSDLAPLTALTSLTLAGLLPPGAGHPSVPAGARSGGRAAAAAALPPQLHTLDLQEGVSPRALALLQPSPAFVRLSVSYMHFGMSDVDGEERIRTETVEAMGPAVRLILAHRDRTYCPRLCYSSITGFTIVGRSEGHVCPREGSLTGHTEWVRQLQGLGGAFDRISLEGIDFSYNPADVSCLGHTLCDVKELTLDNCDVPVTALPLLRCPMLRLTRLVLDLAGSECEGMDSAALVPLLVLLCKPHAGAAPLQHLVGAGCPTSLDLDLCTRAVEEQLQQCYGVTDVSIVLTHE